MTGLPDIRTLAAVGIHMRPVAAVVDCMHTLVVETAPARTRCRLVPARISRTMLPASMFCILSPAVVGMHYIQSAATPPAAEGPGTNLRADDKVPVEEEASAVEDEPHRERRRANSTLVGRRRKPGWMFEQNPV